MSSQSPNMFNHAILSLDEVLVHSKQAGWKCMTLKSIRAHDLLAGNNAIPDDFRGILENIVFLILKQVSQ